MVPVSMITACVTGLVMAAVCVSACSAQDTPGYEKWREEYLKRFGSGQYPGQLASPEQEKYMRLCLKNDEDKIASMQGANQESNSYVNQNCPPAAESVAKFNRDRRKQQAWSDASYLATITEYQANGEMISNKVGQTFDTAAECDRYMAAQLRIAAGNERQLGRVLGKAVYAPADGTGFVWFGCIHPNDARSEQFVKWTATKMTLERARTIGRFPKLEPQSRRGEHVRI